ncbi:similar to Saccharomyces cerevisiae YJL157C FAR1 Cyclin-dependent kinase inhibitor that mediates cell cycle arrest in response to pheromone [Maudiozyma barnettii]|uniref:Similar to Saccharomyces cerevisiae YJL157C FAR1 Cyclin-dependent kinase inhibitor that mediates cell cycle arrest in response to pheromone n=1 Tax=Maudiozyma barnettii TaxID=61262 RepID=A0A8H2ZHR6_9SACH|nr:cyclin-dependent protein serine/threonine kinase inhibiting protein FAR1 [Kazachstania barnettii]CAB4256059.1 similar to Saccharomyces cerevisiae YJL157C FAR1 Cyclin-dependent kinase inhibitor that mediates cell cycle arrest in response to pheromone [Kazachstania barnettii]CAD1784667.1 similar to Saccharomyces cerevisiae YJL157C FAR1 Cyclin-dependent kinase inhibitor that mediates cell cycle arrest in response to pheromone [Kazachstania barnettii]
MDRNQQSANIQTPPRFRSSKKLHTPPSAGSTTPRHTPGKFLRAISGKVFRKSIDGKQVEESGALGQFVPNESKPIMGKRSKIPKPLVLGSPMSMPPSAKKFSHISLKSENDVVMQQLQSPIGFSPRIPPSMKSAKSNRRNLTNTLLIESLSELSELPQNKEDKVVIWADDDDDDDGQDIMSPLYYKKNNPRKRVTSAMGLKKYVEEKCVICEEKVSNSFQGEKIIELDCGHASHYKCYYMAMEMLYGTEKLPECDVCLEDARPTDKETLIDIESKILRRTQEEKEDDVELESEDKCDGTTIAQWLPLHSARGHMHSDRLSLVTPLEQIVVSEQVGSDGFRTPIVKTEAQELSLMSGNVFIDEFDNDQIYQEILKLTEELDSGTYDGSSAFDVNIGNPIVTLENITTSDVNYKSPQQIMKVEIEIPMNDSETTPLRTKNPDILSNNKLKDDNIRASLTEHICSQYSGLQNFNVEHPESHLLMFDEVIYSSEGEHWFQNTVLYYFDDLLILMNVSKDSISGKIPTDQISSITKLNEKHGLLICLKSTTLPEIYLQFSNNMLLNKWEYYLSHLDEKPPLHHDCISNTMFNTLPKTLTKQITELDLGSIFALPWEKTTNETPCRVILCLGLSPPSEGQAEDGSYLKQLCNIINTLRQSLNQNDLLGIVFAGKDGTGAVDSMFGTFVGTMSVSWSGWDDVIGDLSTVPPGVFLTPEREQIAMLTTCCRLASTVVESNPERPAYYNRVILVQDIPTLEDAGSARIAEKYKVRLETTYNFEVSTVPWLEEDTSELLEQQVQDCHLKNMHNLIVKLGSTTTILELNYGSMGSGSTKIMDHTYDGTLTQDTLRSRVCDVTWYDIRLRELVSRSVPVNHK